MIEFIRHALGLCGDGHPSLIAALPLLASLVLTAKIWRARFIRAAKKGRHEDKHKAP